MKDKLYKPMKVRVKISKDGSRSFTAYCHKSACRKLEIYAPPLWDRADDLYEIGGTVGTRAEWRRLFRWAGI